MGLWNVTTKGGAVEYWDIYVPTFNLSSVCYVRNSKKIFLSSFTQLLYIYIYYSADALYKIQLFLIHDISLSFIAKKISVGSQDQTDIYKLLTEEYQHL